MSKISQKYQKLADLKPPEKEEGAALTLYPCIVCQKPIGEGYYSTHGDRGACSRKCMLEADKIPKYPGHEEEDYFRRLAERGIIEEDD